MLEDLEGHGARPLPERLNTRLPECTHRSDTPEQSPCGMPNPSAGSSYTRHPSAYSTRSSVSVIHSGRSTSWCVLEWGLCSPSSVRVRSISTWMVAFWTPRSTICDVRRCGNFHVHSPNPADRTAPTAAQARQRLG